MIKFKSLVYISLGAIGVSTGLNIYNSSEKFYNDVLMPLVHYLNPETAHNLAVNVNKYRLLRRSSFKDPDLLHTRFLDLEVPNPVGIAAGFDKNGEAISGLFDIGFGFIEIGSVTPLPQPGNPKPRVFRLPDDYAIINRYGFNSDGHEIVAKRVELHRQNADVKRVIGINLGRNKDSDDAIGDYIKGIETFGPIADYLVINISSPNTPGLRSLQEKKPLETLLENVIKARNNLKLERKPPVLLKLSSDLTTKECKDVADVIKMKKCQVDGLIISNTTTARSDSLKSKDHQKEMGGLSGQPLSDISTQMIMEMYKLTAGMPIIGVGGIFTGEDAYNKIRAGASLIQLYTSFAYHGPPRITRIKKELYELLQQDGYKNVQEAVGSDVKKLYVI